MPRKYKYWEAMMTAAINASMRPGRMPRKYDDVYHHLFIVTVASMRPGRMPRKYNCSPACLARC